MPIDIFGNALDLMLMIFIVAICVMVLILFVGGYMFPLSQSSFITPATNTPGIGQAQYSSISNEIWLGTKYFVFIMIATPFVILLVKYLYQKDEMSVYRY
jgi:hypothetical protein